MRISYLSICLWRSTADTVESGASDVHIAANVDKIKLQLYVNRWILLVLSYAHIFVSALCLHIVLLDHMPIFPRKTSVFVNCRVSLTYNILTRNSKKNKERWPRIESNFAGKPPIIKHSICALEGNRNYKLPRNP